MKAVGVFHMGLTPDGTAVDVVHLVGEADRGEDPEEEGYEIRVAGRYCNVYRNGWEAFKVVHDWGVRDGAEALYEKPVLSEPSGPQPEKPPRDAKGPGSGSPASTVLTWD